MKVRVSDQADFRRAGFDCLMHLTRPLLPFLILLVLSGCANLVPSKPLDRIWQSDPREPVWVHHSLPPVNGSIFLVQSGISFEGRQSARTMAIRKVAKSLLDRLQSSGIKFTVSERRRLQERFESEIEESRKTLVLKDQWEYKTLPDSGNPFHVESHAWVLVSLSVHFLSRIRQELMHQDRERFRRIRNRHSLALRLLKRYDWTGALLLFSQNLQAFQKIHSEHSFSSSSLRMFLRVYRNEASLWGQFLETVKIRPETSEVSPLQVELHPFHPFSFPIRIEFSISGMHHSLSGFRPVLSLEPLPGKLPFPPVPIYLRKDHSYPMAYRASFLWWSGDLVRYEESERKNVLTSSCTLSSSTGVSWCSVARLPDVLPGSSFRVVLRSGVNKSMSRKLEQAMKRVPGHFPIQFLGRRKRHTLLLRVLPKHFPKNTKTSEIDFKKSLGHFLSLNGFRVEIKGYLQTKRRKSSDLFQKDVLTVRIFPEKIRVSAIPSATIVLLKVPYDAYVRDRNGETLWERKGESEGVGIGRTEARKDALDGLKSVISVSLDALLWSASEEKKGDFFWTMRRSLLDGQAFCEKEEP